MRVVFLSNFFDHHQKEFSDEMYKATSGSYIFVATKKMEQERIALGYNPNDKPEYVKECDLTGPSQIKDCENLVFEADVVITGSSPEFLVKRRLKAGKLTFKYMERIFKKPVSLFQFVMITLSNAKSFWFKKNYYLLCASAYTYRDFLSTGCFFKKAYKWGYFPPTVEYESLDELLRKKERHSILWVGRHIDWKHPEYAVWFAKRLKEEGIDFHLNIIGIGPLSDMVKEYVTKNSLENEVSILGAMPPEKVREYMEKSEVFINTSDRNEGWGAVINEAMNSACAVVVNNKVGAAPYLIQGGNGQVYEDSQFDDFYEKTKMLLLDQNKRISMSKSAYNTIVQQWNAKTASANLIQLSTRLLNGDRRNNVEKGPCSDAPIINYNWYQQK